MNPALGPTECEEKIRQSGSTGGHVEVLAVDFQKIPLSQEALLVSVAGQITPDNVHNAVPQRFQQTFILVKAQFWCIYNDIFRYFPVEEPQNAAPTPTSHQPNEF